MRSPGDRPLSDLEAALAGLLAGFFALLAHLWLLADLLDGGRIAWLAAPVSGLVIGVAVGSSLAPGRTGSVRGQRPAALLLALLLPASAAWLLEPVARRPWGTFGIPNKDLHDGIAAFLADQGRAPWREPDIWKSGWIVNSDAGLFLGYPDVLHAFSALLIRYGVPELAATWVASAAAILASAVAIYLLLVRSGVGPVPAATLAGLFPLSSLRIPFAVVTSIPMAFSFALLLPAVALLELAAMAGAGPMVGFAAVVAVAVVGASYSGSFLLLGGLAVSLLAARRIAGDRAGARRLGGVLAMSLVPLALVLACQRPIFWENTFPTAADYDPFELSQQMRLFDRPLLTAAVVAAALVGARRLLFRGEWREPGEGDRLWIWGVVAGFLLLPAWDAAFHQVTGAGDRPSLAALPADGFFGALAHQKVCRVALIQPFVFPLLLGELARRGRMRRVAPLLFAAVLLGGFAVLPGAGSGGVLRPAENHDLRNREAEAGCLTVPSDLRLVSLSDLWSEELSGEFRQLRRQGAGREAWFGTGREWARESLTNWGSVLARRRMLPWGIEYGPPAPGSWVLVEEPTGEPEPAVRFREIRRRKNVRLLELEGEPIRPRPRGEAN